VLIVRRARDEDAATLWALNALPNIGATADPTVPLPVVPATAPPAGFPDLADVPGSFLRAGGDFLVVELTDDVGGDDVGSDRDGSDGDGRGTDGSGIVGMGGIRPSVGGRAEVQRVRVHPAMRRRGIGRALLTALADRAVALGLRQLHLDTATNQPEAMAFYRSLGYRETHREHQPGWTWTLVYYVKTLP
jgi:ribosomal protein S18 acetylase RimI-like enzyme